MSSIFLKSKIIIKFLLIKISVICKGSVFTATRTKKPETQMCQGKSSEALKSC